MTIYLTEIQHLLAPLKIPFFTFIGAFTLYMINKLHNKKPFSLALVINVDIGPSARSYVIFSDMCISSIIGAIVVIPLTSPSTIPQAIVAGLGMTGLLSASSKV